jgi:MSHA biogenesis protein MshN
MSLLNDMLQDLHNKPSYRPVILPVATINQHWFHGIPKTLLLFISSFILFIITIVIIYWPKHNNHYENIAPLKSTLVPVPTIYISSIPTINFPLHSSLTAIPIFAVDEPGNQVAWYDEKLNSALESIEEGNDPKAIEDLELILTRIPNSIDAREYLAGLYLSHADLPQAYDILDEGLRLEPHNLRLSTMKARLLIEQGQYREALSLLEQFNPKIDKAPEYYALLAAVFQHLGRIRDAGSVYQELIKHDPLEGQYWLGLAVSLEHKNSIQQAIEAYKRASHSDNVQAAVREYAESRLKALQG